MNCHDCCPVLLSTIHEFRTNKRMKTVHSRIRDLIRGRFIKRFTFLHSHPQSSWIRCRKYPPLGWLFSARGCIKFYSIKVFVESQKFSENALRGGSFLVLIQRFNIASRPTTSCLPASAGTAVACAAKRRTWPPDSYHDRTRTG